MEKLLLVLDWLHTAGQTWRMLRLLGIPKLSGWLLKHLVSPAMKGYGFKYYPNRAALNRDYPTLGERFGKENSQTAWALWPIGTTFYDTDKNVHVIKRLILPNPDREIFYFKSVSQHGYAQNAIRTATAKAQKAGAKVRWIDEFLFTSITIVDYDEPLGWAHVETVLPFVINHKNPGYTIYKHRSKEAVKNLVEVYQLLWDTASPAPDIPI